MKTAIVCPSELLLVLTHTERHKHTECYLPKQLTEFEAIYVQARADTYNSYQSENQ